mmetsp:Transcript_24969/g.83315  ORF Transcript_24969/g.83315 Transcript_24969/m.83315 type:complete len:256 (+) Transcript_24969:118-885(+)
MPHTPQSSCATSLHGYSGRGPSLQLEPSSKPPIQLPRAPSRCRPADALVRGTWVQLLSLQPQQLQLQPLQQQPLCRVFWRWRCRWHELGVNACPLCHLLVCADSSASGGAVQNPFAISPTVQNKKQTPAVLHSCTGPRSQRHRIAHDWSCTSTAPTTGQRSEEVCCLPPVWAASRAGHVAESRHPRRARKVHTPAHDRTSTLAKLRDEAQLWKQLQLRQVVVPRLVPRICRAEPPAAITKIGLVVAHPRHPRASA